MPIKTLHFTPNLNIYSKTILVNNWFFKLFPELASLEAHNLLNKKTRITTKLQNNQITYNDLVFYKKYSEYTLKTINKNKFQRFIKYLLNKEKIPESKITQINIRVLPLKNKENKWIIGKCHPSGAIKIFPKARNLCLRIASRFGKKTLFSYIKNRGKAALIHELLHIKYLNDEKKVRTLTKNYFKLFNKNKIPNSTDKLLFS